MTAIEQVSAVQPPQVLRGWETGDCCLRLQRSLRFSW
jgi:hypothetical protein